jgi:hypothetical protein
VPVLCIQTFKVQAIQEAREGSSHLKEENPQEWMHNGSIPSPVARNITITIEMSQQNTTPVHHGIKPTTESGNIHVTIYFQCASLHKTSTQPCGIDEANWPTEQSALV